MPPEKDALSTNVKIIFQATFQPCPTRCSSREVRHVRHHATVEAFTTLLGSTLHVSCKGHRQATRKVRDDAHGCGHTATVRYCVRRREPTDRRAAELVAGLARRLGAHLTACVRASCRRTGDVTRVIFNLQNARFSQRIRWWDVTVLTKELRSNNQQPCTKNVTD